MHNGKTPARRCAIALSLSAAILLSLNAAAAEVTVFAAASLTDSLKEIASNYEKQATDKIVFNFGASSVLARQIAEGAPADIFFSADEAKMNDLEQRGLILKETRTSRLSNSLVIVVASDRGAAISDPKDLATDKVKRIALAEPSSVPAGIYAKAYLQKQHLWDAVEPKVVATENVRATLAAVESGDVDAGIIYKTDAATSRKVRVAYQIRSDEGPPISYPMALLKESGRNDAARRFFDYLRNKSAGAAFQRYGFIVRD